MTNDATRASAEVLPKINRRHLLLHTATVSAAALIATPTVAASGLSKLAAIIEEHRAAHAQVSRALDAQQKAEKRFEQAWAKDFDRRLVDIQMGSRKEVYVSAHRGLWETRESLRKEVANAYSNMERALPTSLSEITRVTALQELRSARRAAYRRVSQKLQEVQKELDRSGYEKAAQWLHDAFEHEEAVAVAFMLHPCATPEEWRMKSQYLDDPDRKSAGASLRSLVETASLEALPLTMLAEIRAKGASA